MSPPSPCAHWQRPDYSEPTADVLAMLQYGQWSPSLCQSWFTGECLGGTCVPSFYFVPGYQGTRTPGCQGMLGWKLYSFIFLSDHLYIITFWVYVEIFLLIPSNPPGYYQDFHISGALSKMLGFAFLRFNGFILWWWSPKVHFLI